MRGGWEGGCGGPAETGTTTAGEDDAGGKGEVEGDWDGDSVSTELGAVAKVKHRKIVSMTRTGKVALVLKRNCAHEMSLITKGLVDMS